MANTREQSLILVKHDGVQRGLVGEVIRRFENRGFKLVGIKFVQVSLLLILLRILFKTVWFNTLGYTSFTRSPLRRTQR